MLLQVNIAGIYIYIYTDIAQYFLKFSISIFNLYELVLKRVSDFVKDVVDVGHSSFRVQSYRKDYDMLCLKVLLYYWFKLFFH